MHSDIKQIIATMPRKQYASRSGYRAAIVRHVRKVAGIDPVSVGRDAGGNCLVCGEAGRCIGLHLFGEVSLAIGRMP